MIGGGAGVLTRSGERCLKNALRGEDTRRYTGPARGFRRRAKLSGTVNTAA